MRAMKDSGIPWLGQIPEHWETHLVLKMVWLRARLGWRGLKAEEYVERGYPFLSAFNIDNQKLRWEDLNYITKERYEESPEIKLSIGDVLLVKDGAIGKCARVDSLPLGEATVNSSLAVVTASSKLYYVYLYYFFVSSTFQHMSLFLKNGMGVPHLTQENMKSIRMPVPPLLEQKRIAEYLDGKCAEIDELISVEEKMIAELQAYKQSVITETVTRGLNPAANNWREVKVGRIANYINGRAFEPSEWQSEGLPIVRIQNLSDPEAPFNYSPETYESKYLLRDGDLLFAWSASLDAFIWNRGKAWLNQHIFKVEPHDFVDKHFLYYELKFMLQDICNQTHGSGMVHITKKHFENLLVHLPPLPEQERISEYLDRKCEEIDALVEVKQRKIEELKEYRKSVIYEYVTGKREIV